jgi:hypothetical protein
MSRLIPAADRIKKARALIQQARDLPVPADSAPDPGSLGSYFSYAADVKDLLRQARELIKFIPYSVGSSAEIKREVADIVQETEQAEKDILHTS